MGNVKQWSEEAYKYADEHAIEPPGGLTRAQYRERLAMAFYAGQNSIEPREALAEAALEIETLRARVAELERVE